MSTRDPDVLTPVIEAPTPSVEGFKEALAAGDAARAEQYRRRARPRGPPRRTRRRHDRGARKRLHDGIGDEALADLLRELEAEDAGDLLRRFPLGDAADILDEFEPDDAADVVEAIEEAEPALVSPLLVEMESAEDVRELLAYESDTAGGRMTTDFLAVGPETTAEDAIQTFRERAQDGRFQSYIYVTDPQEHLLGVAPLYRLVMADPRTPVTEFMTRDPIRVEATDDQTEVAAVFRQRHFLAVPVTDAQGRLMGIVTADDVADILDLEATEDMYRMAGVGVTERATGPVLESLRHRVPWLTFNMIWSLGAAIVISIFEPTIQAAAVLAVFIPVITGQAGNSGIQTATIMIRSLALGDVTPRDTLRLLGREWTVGAVKGLIFGVSLALIAIVWKGNVVLGLIVGVSLFLNIAIVASTTGVLLPMTLQRLGVDPATVAGVFDTMLSDLMGNFIYLGLATLLLASLT